MLGLELLSSLSDQTLGLCVLQECTGRCFSSLLCVGRVQMDYKVERGLGTSGPPPGWAGLTPSTWAYFEKDLFPLLPGVGLQAPGPLNYPHS